MTDDDPLYFGRDGQPITLMEWSDRFESDKEVAHTVLAPGNEVRTVWLGTHDDPMRPGPPLIFGTAVKGDQEWHEVRRYATEADAVAGHEEIVRSRR
jgi:hypothetical protein